KVGVVTELLHQQFIAEVDGVEIFFFYVDQGNTWEIQL
ncbi:unnamed protein product, partial [marine sediment metagenome]